jgi:2-amino-4-hydroxy-6-hydroxymethyldihydropteridine diphosphokinase
VREGRHEALVSLGSNIEPERWVPAALDALRRRFGELVVSPLYDAPAVGGPPGAPPVVNAAARLRTDLPAPALRVALREIERRCGRRRTADAFAPRTMDLDLLWIAPATGEPGSPATGSPATGLPAPDLLAHAHLLVPAADAWPEARPWPDRGTLAEEARRRFPAGAHALVARA